jgi:hypothetical protein
VKPSIKVTGKQIRFLLDSGRVWMIQQLHVPGGVPKELQGNYDVPLEEQRHGWGNLKGATELKILRAWVASGFKL